jgi:hypothetical protein
MKKILLIVVCFSFLAAINAYSAEIAWMLSGKIRSERK